MKIHEPSRVLNETRLTVFGITVQDFIYLVGIYGVLQVFYMLLLNKNTIWPIFTLIIITLVLVAIRNTQRRHIIRDSIKYLYNKIIRSGEWYAA